MSHCPTCNRLRKPNITLHEGRTITHHCNCGHQLKLTLQEMPIQKEKSEKTENQTASQHSQTDEK